MAGMVLPWNLAMKDQLYLYPTGVGKKTISHTEKSQLSNLTVTHSIIKG